VETDEVVEAAGAEVVGGAGGAAAAGTEGTTEVAGAGGVYVDSGGTVEMGGAEVEVKGANGWNSQRRSPDFVLLLFSGEDIEEGVFLFETETSSAGPVLTTCAM
jgi:hypothetical protein